MHIAPKRYIQPIRPSRPPYTARSLAEELGATVVIRLNTEQQRFEGFITRDDSGPGFSIDGGQGYIVNVPQAKQVAFVGAAWTNTPPRSDRDLRFARPVEAAPSEASRTAAWAFVVSGTLLDMPEGMVSVRN